MSEETTKPQKPNHQGEGGGRPRIFETVEDLDRMAEAYFKRCEPHEEEVENDDGEIEKKQVWGEPCTAYGLSISCGTTWDTLREYRKGTYDKPGQMFSVAINWWVEQIKHFAEKSLYTARSPAGPIFHLVNLTRNDGDSKWVNAQHTDLNHSGSIDVSGILKEARERAANG